MNYGQVLETLKAHPLQSGVKLRGGDGSFDIDDVTHSKIEDDAARGFGLFTQGGTSGNPMDAPPVRTVADLLITFRAIDGDSPDFTEPVTICTPVLRGVAIDRIDVDADGVLYFDALAEILATTDAALAEKFGAGEPLGDATRENAALPACHLSPPAAGVLNAMGLGMRLRVPHGGGPAMLDDATNEGRESLGPVNPEHVQELVGSGQITKLTKDRNGSRLGWDEKGLDGDKADFYVCVQ